MSFSGRVDTETDLLFERLLSPLPKPRPTADGQPDPRGGAERYGDAFAELLGYAHRAGHLPTEAEDRPTVSVELDFNRLLGGLSTVALLNGSEPLTAEQVRRLACNAEVIPAVFGSHHLKHRIEASPMWRWIRNRYPTPHWARYPP